MNLLMLQPVADGRSYASAYRDEVASLGAALRLRRHRVGLLVLRPDDQATLASVLIHFRPSLILMYIDSLAADVAVRAAGTAASATGAPVIAFGPHARLCPDECLSMVGVEAVAVGPADLVAPDYIEARARRVDSDRVAGFWVKCETGVMRNAPPRPPESLAWLPPAARDLYPPLLRLDTAGMARVEVARGGEGGPPSMAGPDRSARAPQPDPWQQAPWPVLHRTVDSVIREMIAVGDEQIDLGGWRIGNERWAASPRWLAELAPRYAREVGLPIRTTLHPADVTDETAALLRQAGCQEVRIRVGSGSAFIRTEMLGLAATTEQIESAFAALRRAGISSVASVEVGSPYETPVTLDETVALLCRLDPDRVEAALHYPVPGTAAYRAAKENGWLAPDALATYLSGRPALALKTLSANQVLETCQLLPYVVHRPRIVPLLRAARRVRMGRWGTLYDLLIKPLLAPPVRRRP